MRGPWAKARLGLGLILLAVLVGLGTGVDLQPQAIRADIARHHLLH
jgi:hypothetical protein